MSEWIIYVDFGIVAICALGVFVFFGRVLSMIMRMLDEVIREIKEKP
jgi:uncharacterized protein YoxC